MTTIKIELMFVIQLVVVCEKKREGERARKLVDRLFAHKRRSIKTEKIEFQKFENQKIFKKTVRKNADRSQWHFRERLPGGWLEKYEELKKLFER